MSDKPPEQPEARKLTYPTPRNQIHNNTVIDVPSVEVAPDPVVEATPEPIEMEPPRENEGYSASVAERPKASPPRKWPKKKSHHKAKPKVEAKPGTQAHADELAAKTGNGSIPHAYTDEGIAEKNASRAEPSGVIVLKDEWYGRLDSGQNPFDDAAKPYVEGNPDKSFRWLSKRVIDKGRGRRGYQQVNDPKGRPVELSGMPLGWIPKEVSEKRKAEQQERTNALRRKSREEYMAAQAKLAKDSQGAIQPGAIGSITERIGDKVRDL